MTLFLSRFSKSTFVLGAFGIALGCAGSIAVAQTGPAVPGLSGANPEFRAQLHDQTSRNKLLLSSLLGRLRVVEDTASARVLEESIWKVWLRSGSPTIDLLMRRILRAMSASDSAKALKLLDRVVDLAPEFAEGWNKRATVLFVVGQYEASLEDIERVLALEPRHFGALSGRGMILEHLDDKKGALAAYRDALQIHPHLSGPKQAVKVLTKEVEGQGI